MYDRVSSWIVAGLIAAGMSGCATGEPMMNRIEKLETMQRTERSESKAEHEALMREISIIMTRMDAINRTQADLVDSMSTQSAVLQNAVEKLQHSASTVPVIQTYDPQRSQASVDASSQTDSTNPVSGYTAATDQRPEVVYQTAYNDYINRNYDLAVLEFQGFLSAFPDTDLADNSQYWIGECYYAQKRFDKALEQFELILANYPDGDKYVAALLKKGLCLIESGDNPSGQKALEELIDKHPYSSEARIAQDRIQNP